MGRGEGGAGIRCTFLIFPVSLKLPPKKHFKHFFTFFKRKNDSPAFGCFKHCSERLQLEGRVWDGEDRPPPRPRLLPGPPT